METGEHRAAVLRAGWPGPFLLVTAHLGRRVGTKRSSLTSSSHPVPLSPQQHPASVSFLIFIIFSSLPSRLGYPPGSVGFCLLCKLGHRCLELDQTPTEAASVVLVGTQGPAGVQDAFSTCFGISRLRADSNLGLSLFQIFSSGAAFNSHSFSWSFWAVLYSIQKQDPRKQTSASDD